MGIKAEEIAVYPVTVFDATKKSFWFGALESILEAHVFLEHPHKQSFYMLLFIERAEGYANVDQQRIRLDQSKVICIKPNSVFSLDINRSAKGFVICFTEVFFSLRYNDNMLYQFAFLKKEAESFIGMSIKQTERWNTLRRLMEEEYVNAQEGVEKVLRSYLNILLYDLHKNSQSHRSMEWVSSKEEKIIQFEKLLEEKYAEQKTPSYYARQLNITTNYLNRLCRDCRDITGGEMIRKRVVIEAQRLLHYTSLSVSEVAYALGFESASYFITFFKKSIGVTPEFFRKNNN